MSAPKNAGAPRRRAGSRLVLGLAAVLCAALCFLGYQWWLAGQERAAARAQLLADVAHHASQRPVDTGELSRLAARLQKFEDHGSDRTLVAAMARIELARGRAERARALLLPIASQPGAAAAEQRLAAAVLLRCHEAGTSDRGTAVGMLRQAAAFAETAWADSRDAADLGNAWLAAARLPDAALQQRYTDQLQAAHADTPMARLAVLARDFRLDLPRGELDALRAEFADPPAEIDAMLATVVLQQNDVPGALAIAEAALLRTPGIDSVRHAAALAFHVCVVGHAASAEERAPWVARRDAQLDWLDVHAANDDSRRSIWATLRALR